MSIRRVVTGTDEEGRAVVARDERVLYTETPVRPGYEFHGLWGTNGAPSTEAVLEPFYPAVGETRFGLVRIPPHTSAPVTHPPATPGVLPGLAEVLDGSETPGMHETRTLDYEIVVEGVLTLELDLGRELTLPVGSCVVQNGTRHSWHNRSDEPAALAYVLIGAD